MTLGLRARPLRIEFHGAIYHVSARMLGNWKKESNLLFENDRDLSRFMHRLSTAYTVSFNRRHQRHGHLLDGRYKARVVERNEYLLALLRRRRESALRGVAARMLCRYAGLTQREVAQTLEMGSGSAVSRQLSNLADRIQTDRALRRHVGRIEEQILQRPRQKES